MKHLCSLLLCLIPMTLHAQGLLENMQAEIAANKQKADNLAAELLVQKAKVATLETDMAGQKVITTALQAELNAEKLKVAALEASVLIHKNRLDAAEARIAQLAARVAALENPNPPPPPPPPPPPTNELTLELKGGWRIDGDYARGAIAIDHATRKLYMVGHGQRNEVNEYQLPAQGIGSDPLQWPRVLTSQIIPGWWKNAAGAFVGYGYGLAFFDGKLWCSPRHGYATKPEEQPAVTTWYASDGETKVFPVQRQKFAGFVKGLNSLELGGGGYESGQGWGYGPNLAKQDGTILVHNTQDNIWEKKTPREPNYWPFDGKDSWVCLTPRDASGIKAAIPITDTTGLFGRWACDRIWGGGFRHSTGVYFWVMTGVGDLNYARQNSTFAASAITYLHRYDPVTYEHKGWKQWQGGTVRGQDLSPDGKLLYLLESAGDHTDAFLKVYEVK